MRALVLILALVGLVYTSGCTSSQVQSATETGLILAGEDPEKAGKIGQGVGQVAGSLAPMPYETERGIGGGIAIQSFATQGPLHPSEELQRYVNMVGLSLVRESTRNGFPFSFAVIEQDEVNAWAAPGGYVFITSGAIREMDDESQLAGVLAHEIGHITEGHLVRMLKRGQFLEGVVTIGATTGSEDMQKYSGAIGAGEQVLFQKGIDRSMEFEADEIGTDLATLTGYDPRGLELYLRRLNQISANKGGGWLTSTHPPLGERISRLAEKNTGQYASITGATARERFQKIVGAALTK